MPDTTSRTALREADASFETADLACREISGGIAYSQAGPPVPPEQDLSARLSAALAALTSQGWDQFFADSAATVADNPVDFSLYIIAGTCEYIIAELEGAVELGMSVVGFAAEYWECARDLGRPLTIWDLDEILTSNECVAFHQSALALKSIHETLLQFRSLSTQAMQELVREMAPVVGELLVTVLEEGLDLLGEQKEEIALWLHETAHDVERLGKLLGTIVGTILLEVATAGVARGMKAARMLNRLPDAPDVLPGMLLPDAGLRVAAIVVTAGPRKDPLDVLAERIFIILQKHGRRFSYNLSWVKRSLLRKHIPAAELAEFAKWRKRLNMAMAAAFHANKGKIMPYSEGKAFVKKFNRRALTYHYSDAVMDDKIDEFDLLTRKDAILPDVLEANHIVEARMFEARARAWASEMAKLGWTSVDDMATVMMSAAEHRGSVARMLKRYGLEPHEIRALEPPESITAILLDKVQLRERLNTSPPLDVLIVERDTPFITVLTRYADLYKEHSPELWNQSLCAQFNTWRTKLGLSAPVFTPRP